MSLAACGYLGIELQDSNAPSPDPVDPMGGLDGSIGADGSTGHGSSDGGSDTPDGSDAPDGGAYPGPVGTPQETEVCIGSVCSSSVDRCPDDEAKVWPGVCGCGVPDVDQDDDGTPDCIDLCPGTPDQLEDGTCGCEAAQADSDRDGVPNCFDYCPQDKDKTGPGVCGCGRADDDLDDDGMPDCADECADDPLKISAGLCGCGLEDSEIDSDEDGIPDCTDTCGGLDDSKYVPDASCGQGYCRTHNTPSSCEDGEETACEPAPQLAADDGTCDGVDDDCDGNVDEDYVPTHTATTCGSGACERFAEMRCANGVMTEVCQAGNGAANDLTCDGVDDDCNGQTDDGYQSIATTCGTGACASTGSLMCTEGDVVDTCQAGTAAPDDSVCNGIDDDCDGDVDEDYLPTQTATTCGSGACQRFGTRQCVDGSLVEECKAGNSAPNDATCDGVDDDCDGLVDEDYVPTPTSCGVGACGRTGTLSCQNGRVVDTCAPGTPAANDQSCNNIDDDCDGSIDEDYVVTATNCGVGACGRTGNLTCQSGAQIDSCTPGSPAANDQSCNNIDDDCDGSVDEDYVSDASCGVGYCQQSNTPSSCVSGVETACVPGTKLSDDDTTADGVDDDCDGEVDEDACAGSTVNYQAGQHTLTPPTGCRSMTVKLWGGGGAAGDSAGVWSAGDGGEPGPGGAGGFASGTLSGLSAASAIRLYVGQGGQGCTTAGASSFTDPTFAGSGGAGANNASSNGTAGSGAANGGAGGNGSAGDGGQGRYGGGGGGSGSATIWTSHGKGAGGGGASALFRDASLAVLAGGGGGGGGSGTNIAGTKLAGAKGGGGCGLAGTATSSGGGSGGGGGLCTAGTSGTTTSSTSTTAPNAGDLPNGTTYARGGATASTCSPGGNGFAIVTWAP